MKQASAMRFGAAVAVFALATGTAQAERPMAVDDAGTLDRGGAKAEFGWSKDDRARGFDGAVGYGPLENVEVELNFAQARDAHAEPDVRARGVGAALKWVPLQAEQGLSAGVKLDFGKVWAKAHGVHEEAVKAYALTGLATWTYASGAAVHLNLGREWLEFDQRPAGANTWGLGASYPLNDKLDLAAEVFGAEEARPDRQVGVRYEVAKGLKVSAAVGRGNDRSFGNLGVAWEF